MNLLVISPCFYHTDKEAALMVESCHKCGLNVQLYGVGVPFVPHGADAQVLKLYEFMENKQADYALITDSRDAVFVAGEEEIMAKFHSFGKDMVMSAERECWPWDQTVIDYFHGTDPNGYSFVNGGQYIGTWEFIRHSLKHILDTYRYKTPLDNSQGWWMWALMRKELDFVLDSGCQIFQTMSGGADGHLTEGTGRPQNIYTGSTPCSIHYNGNSNTVNPHQGMFTRVHGS